MTTTLDKKIQTSMIDRPFKALEGCTTAIYAALEKAEKAAKNPIPLNKEAALGELRTAVHATIDYVTFAILNFQTTGTGFPSDPTGLLAGNSTFSSAPMMKKYQFSSLVQVYANEYLAKKAVEPLEDNPNSDVIISDTEAAKLLASTDDIVDATLTSGETVTFNRIDNTVGVRDTTNSSIITWVKVKADLGKNWLISIWNQVVAWGVMIKEWCIEKYVGMKNFFCSDNDTIAPTTTTP